LLSYKPDVEVVAEVEVDQLMRDL